MKLNLAKNLRKGFSLVEMLVVIAVIGIIAAIAVPNIGRINDSAKEATARRNAQNVASVFASAQAAGLNFAAASTTPSDIVTAVVTGAKVTEKGPFENTWFGVPGLTSADQTAALKYLSYDSNSAQLLYNGGVGR
ncbi:MAG: prepilin-type N-terminal cleavage/methylation domain-containing protein [Verrucomicrobiae bacterium]|nr:prepilin-type N-terminal cleavage/methylation domain-containing protein [Verrucomicrobiae bacterium]